ncbi:MAG TPA: T9SS type A sorting domain-containing protein [Melioribacteraceae bacterium]|nr:T9SS type A sorting domain-containing protein [Melioribacteraceae bacterium]
MNKFTIAILLLLFSIPILSQWNKTNFNELNYGYSMAFADNTIYVGTLSKGMFKSTDNGFSWIEINNNLPIKQVWSVNVINGVVFIGTNSGGIYKSTNNGESWESSNNGISNNAIIKDINKYENKYFAASSNAGIYVSDNGNDWQQNNSGITGLVASCLLNTGNDLFCGVLQRVYKYDLANTSWIRMSTGLPNSSVNSLAYFDDNSTKYLAAGFYSSVSEFAISSDYGLNWIIADNALPNVPIYSVSAVNNVLLVGNDYGVYISYDKGNNWSDFSQGFTGASYSTFLTKGLNSIFVLYKGGVWKRDISDFITSVEDNFINNFHYSLFQNYPNPFNPSTTISFILPTSGFVSLKVFDSLGKEVTTLINEEKQAGSHSINFDAKNLSSGIYYYKLTTGNFIETKKMVLVR